MTESLRELLKKCISEINENLATEDYIAYLETLYDCIVFCNPKFSLIKATEEEIITRHIADSLAPVDIIKRYVPSASYVADLGSGAGMPGLVLTPLFPSDFALVERKENRARFLNYSIARLHVADRVKVLEQDLKTVKNTFDCVVFRAFRPFEDILKDLVRITKSGSFVFAYKAMEENVQKDVKYINENAGQFFETETVKYEVPFCDYQRCLLVMKRR